MINILVNIIELEKMYLTGNSCRIELSTKIKSIKDDFKELFFSKKFKDCQLYKLSLIFFLERIKRILKFEDNLLEMVQNYTDEFYKNLDELLAAPETICSEEYLKFISEIEQHQRSKKIMRRANYPHKVTKILKTWLEENMKHPYPSEIQKILFCEKTGLDICQINNWFINARRRILPLLRRDDRNKHE
ncbi:hypothetical protein NCER_101346 [Vairimorpha ceranae BRL01]|uniref:Homeobox domain-containing protein n=2 Tax=Vairimorpha ceranae TaxID=40302 RepID=C4V9T2_VAIC1|nr:homeobox transcription [Vairimorpha ceranae]EEQ82021.1 hypothetical protein NCER_101346 [Vairimorpha ceranae BRL01]KKO76452.1 homeobox transcription [Vairimorpha ceranae]